MNKNIFIVMSIFMKNGFFLSYSLLQKLGIEAMAAITMIGIIIIIGRRANKSTFV